MPGLGIAVAHQLHQLLRRRLIAAAAIAVLLRHRATNPWPLRFRRAGFAGRGFVANIAVAIAHDCYPLLKLNHNAQPLRRVAVSFG
jgi:hypothetical protein